MTGTLFSSLDGFATPGDAIGSVNLVGAGYSGSFFSRAIDLSSLSLRSTDPVEFRLCLDDGGASVNANSLRLDNLTLNAAITRFPEPGTSVLALLGLLGLGFCRRWRKR